MLTLFELLNGPLQFNQHVLDYRDHLERQWCAYRAEFFEDKNYAWHPDDPCATLIHKNP